MGGINPYANMGLDKQVQTSYAGALGGMSDLARGGALAKTNINQYLNPYTQNVVNTTMGEMNRQQTLDRNRIAGEAQSQNAFGGDRFAIENAENNRNWAAQKADTTANLYNQGFNTAVGNAQQDINTRAGALESLGGLSNQGFGWGNTLADQTNRAAGQQQQAMQGLSDAIKAQYQGFTQQGTNPGLNALLGVFSGLGSNMSSSSAKGKSSSTQFGLSGK